jgi:hypothetical protein
MSEEKIWKTIWKLEARVGVLQDQMAKCNSKAEEASFVALIREVYRRLHGLYAQVGA